MPRIGTVSVLLDSLPDLFRSHNLLLMKQLFLDGEKQTGSAGAFPCLVGVESYALSR